MKAVPRLPRLVFLLTLSAAVSCGLTATPPVVTAKQLIEQPERETEGDPEDFTDAPKYVTPTVRKPPSEAIAAKSRRTFINFMLNLLRQVKRSIGRAT
jgi:hypothetical protein